MSGESKGTCAECGEYCDECICGMFERIKLPVREYEKCGEDCINCDCKISMAHQIEELQEDIITAATRIHQIEKQISLPGFENILTRVDNLGKGYQDALNKLQDNTNRVNQMLLELKGIVAMTRSFWKGNTAKTKIQDFLDDLNSSLKE
jgi:hypothetical protein